MKFTCNPKQTPRKLRGWLPILFSAALIASQPAAFADRGAPSRHFAVTQTTPAGATPHFPAYDPGSGNVLVSNVSAATVSEIKLGAGVVRVFPAQAQSHTVKIDAPARRGYVVNKGANSVSVLDLAAGTTIAHFSVGPNPHGLAIDRKRGRIYVTSIDANRLEIYDARTFQQIATVPVGLGPWGVDARGDIIVTTDTGGNTIHIIDADDLEVRDVVEVGQYPWNPSIGASGTIYVTVQGSGEMVAVYEDEVIWRTPIGAKPLGIVADESRDVVLASVSGTNQVAAVSARSGRLLQLIDVLAQPAGITYNYKTGDAYVANQGAGVVSTISAASQRRP